MRLGFYGLRPGFGGLALLALLGNGFCVAALIPAQTSLYETIDREFRGRAFALFGAAMAAAPLPGYFLAGTLAASVASTTVIALCGLAVVAQATVTSVQLARVGGRGQREGKLALDRPLTRPIVGAKLRIVQGAASRHASTELVRRRHARRRPRLGACLGGRVRSESTFTFILLRAATPTTIGRRLPPWP